MRAVCGRRCIGEEAPEIGVGGGRSGSVTSHQHGRGSRMSREMGQGGDRV